MISGTLVKRALSVNKMAPSWPLGRNRRSQIGGRKCKRPSINSLGSMQRWSPRKILMGRSQLQATCHATLQRATQQRSGCRRFWIFYVWVYLKKNVPLNIFKMPIGSNKKVKSDRPVDDKEEGGRTMRIQRRRRPARLEAQRVSIHPSHRRHFGDSPLHSPFSMSIIETLLHPDPVSCFSIFQFEFEFPKYRTYVR